MAAILNSLILNFAILDSAILVFPLKLTHTCQDWFPPFAQKKLHSHFPPYHLEKKNFTHWFWLNFMMAAILNSVIPNSIILDSAIWVFPLKLTHTCQDWFPPFAQKKLHSHFPPYHLEKKTFTHWFWLNLMMAAISNSAMLDSETLFSSLRFTQKHSHSTLSLTQINLIWLKLIHSDSTWWWQPSWILPSWIQPFCIKKLHSCILTELDDGSHLEFCHVWFIHCHLGFRHLRILSQIHLKTLSLYSDPASN